MSFSTEVKEELSAKRLEKPCCMLSELNALTQFCGSMTLHGRGLVSISYTTENVTVAKRIFLLLKRRLEINAAPHFAKLPRFGGKRVCIIRLQPADSRKLMYALHMLHQQEGGEVFRGIPRRALTRKCCQQAFLRGAFLGAGSVTAPESSYHMEFVCDSEKRAETIMQLLRRSDMQCAVNPRRGASVVYMKHGAQISAFLGMSGAVRAMMRYENILAQRSLRESVMRSTNCDHNNMMRQISAAQKQIASIRALQRSSGIYSLPDDLREIALLRLQNPDASLEQLGEMLSPPLGKSGVNHRLRKIALLAAQKNNEKQEEESCHDFP